MCVRKCACFVCTRTVLAQLFCELFAGTRLIKSLKRCVCHVICSFPTRLICVSRVLLLLLNTDYYLYWLFSFTYNIKRSGFVTEIVAVYCLLETDFLDENNVKLALRRVKFHSIVILFLIPSEAVCYPFSNLLSLTNCVGVISYLWKIRSWIYDI